MSTETVNQQIPAGTWTVDTVHSAIQFAVVNNSIATYRSGFNDYSATLTGGEQPRLEGTVEVAGIDIDEPQLKGHLLSPGFFDAEQYPQFKFSSTELVVEDDGTVRLEGELEIHGQTRRVQATGKFGKIGADLGGGERVGLSLAAAIDRRDFGIDFDAQLPSGGNVLEYEVGINVELQFVAQAS
jgi:polyisoprenoid-binding protein YceI